LQNVTIDDNNTSEREDQTEEDKTNNYIYDLLVAPSARSYSDNIISSKDSGEFLHI